jgi:DinB superfamily
MKTLALALLLLVTPVLSAQTPLAADNGKLVQHLDRTSAKFLASVHGLSEAQWNYKPAPDKWSVAECAEHIAAAESFIRAAIEKSLAGPAAKKAALKDAVKDDAVTAFVVDRSKSFKAPEPLAPSNRFGSPAAAVQAFETERAKTTELAKTSTGLRTHTADHPGFGPLDAYGWMLFLSAHTERHTLQIEEIKSSDAYPVR